MIMRTTLTLDEDIAAKLKAETRRTGKSFKAAVNDTLRLGLNARRKRPPTTPFAVHARDLGSLRPGISLDDIGAVLEQAEGSDYR